MSNGTSTTSLVPSTLQIPTGALLAGGIVVAIVGITLLAPSQSEEARLAAPSRRREAAIQKREQRVVAIQEHKQQRFAGDVEKARTKVEKALDATEKKRSEVAAIGTAMSERKTRALDKKIDRINDLADKIESGQLSASELRELMASGTLRLKNPEPSTYDQACAMSNRLPGHDCAVGELSTTEQTKYGLPRYVVAIGPLESISYRRGSEVYEHEAGDETGIGQHGHGNSYLVADPTSGRPAIIPGKMRYAGGWLRG